MKIKSTTSDWKTIETDLLLYPVSEEDLSSPGADPGRDDPLLTIAGAMAGNGEWKPSRGGSLVLYRPRGCAAERVGLIGLGKKQAGFNPGAFRTAVMNVVRSLKSGPLENITAVLGPLLPSGEACRMLFEGIYLGRFDPAVHKSGSSQLSEPGEITLVSAMAEGEALQLLEESKILAEAVNLARRFSNEPGNLLYPEAFVIKAGEELMGAGLKVKVMEEAELRENGFGCLLGVAQGSGHRPRVLILEHDPHPGKRTSPIVLVGKGVTFDSGGISIKPSASMEEMRADKSGACTVLAAMSAASRLELPTRVVGIMPLVENLPGGNAQRPGDVVRAYNGTTVEIINTDAEGRLILADALAWAVEHYQPRFLVDIATLTGACVIALGHHRAGLFSNDDALSERLCTCAGKAGEKFWRLPLDDEYRASLESKIADIKNCGDRWGGAITAAKFLESFVDERPWCHIDMAGTDFFPSGINEGTPPGFGVRTLVELIRESRD